MFGRKPCPRCETRISKDFSFCPHCGVDMRNPQQELDDYGLLGKNEMSNTPTIGGGNLGFTDKILNSIINQFMKSLESQMKNQDPGQGQGMPNNIRITVGPATQPKQVNVQKARKLTDDQVKRMSGAPRVEAKTDVRRLSDKVIYELKAPGITSLNDVFVSKVESGYEFKAIGKNKVYFNNLPVDLPMKSYTLHEKGLTVEFALH